ncbi:MAG: 3-dehydroquinate synthase [Nitrospirales bacterium]|nr:3-dehydroquinate synthase [Nitrospirales bacterium]
MQERVEMKTIRQQFKVSYDFPVIFTHDVFAPENRVLCDVLAESGQKRNRMLVVIDSCIFDSTPALIGQIERYAGLHDDMLEFVDSPYIMKGGESSKNDASEVEKIHALIEKHHLCRHSFVLVIGGGAVLDAAGYAVATAHRGIRLIRMPATTLAQNDAGVGVKNGINAFGRKNFLGTFAPPFAIINDFDFLKTLPVRDIRAGIAEAVKVALIKDRVFFDFLYSNRHRLAAFEPDVMEHMIIRCAELHMEHIGGSGDPFEFGTARPLDFGHWSAHKLEELTKGDIKHGEAVAVGIALDSLYAYHIGYINELEMKRILVTLEDIGFRLYHWALGWMDIEKALREFQEHLGGELTITLLNGIGSRIEVHEIDTVLLRQCVAILAERKKEKEIGNVPKQLPDVGKRDCRPLLP